MRSIQSTVSCTFHVTRLPYVSPWRALTIFSFTPHITQSFVLVTIWHCRVYVLCSTAVAFNVAWRLLSLIERPKCVRLLVCPCVRSGELFLFLFVSSAGNAVSFSQAACGVTGPITRISYSFCAQFFDIFVWYRVDFELFLGKKSIVLGSPLLVCSFSPRDGVVLCIRFERWTHITAR